VICHSNPVNQMQYRIIAVVIVLATMLSLQAYASG
jgi:hypothetical protein